MANLRTESFNGSACVIGGNNDLGLKWPNVHISGSFMSNFITTQFGRQYFTVQGSYLQDLIPSNAGIVIGARWIFTGDNGGTGSEFLYITDSSHSFDNDGLSLKFTNQTGSIVVRDPTGTIILTCPGAIAAYNTEIYIEVKCIPSPSTGGSVTVYVNGVQVGTVSGVRTTNTDATFNYYSIGGVGLSPLGRVTDIYVNDLTGSINNNVLGDMKVLWSQVNGDGGLTAWSIGGSSPAATRWQSVSETLPDYDVTDITDATVGHQNSFTISVPANLYSINSLQINGMIRKDDATIRQVKLFVRISGTIYYGSLITLSTSYIYYHEIWDKNPATGIAWVVADLTGLEVGIEVIT